MRSIRLAVLFLIFSATHVYAIGEEGYRVVKTRSSTAIGSFACDSNGNVLYQGGGSVGNNPLYQGLYVQPSSGGLPLTVTGSDFARSIVGPVTLTDSGYAVFQSVGSPPVNGIFSKAVSGGNLITIRGSNLGTPDGAAVSDRKSGSIIYLDREGPETMRLYSSPVTGGVPLTITGQDFLHVSRPSVDPDGPISYAASGADNVTRLYVQPSSGAIPLTVQGSNFRMGQKNTMARYPGAAMAVYFDGYDDATQAHQLYLATLDPGTSEFKVKSSPGSLTSGSTCQFSCNAGFTTVVFDGATLKLLKPKETDAILDAGAFTTTDLLAIDQPFMGSTISALSLGEHSLLDNGDLYVNITFADNTNGIFVVTVPEPGCLGVIAMAIGHLALRRRRVAAVA